MKAAAAVPPDAGAINRLSASPYYNALLRTTCVATRLDGGHADNALPQTARATVNCRLLPGHSPEEAQRALARILADPRIQVSRVGGRAAADSDRVAPPSAMEPELLSAFERVSPTMWPGVPVVPTMETGGTDGHELRPAGIPTFGISGVFIDIDDVRAHGKDERVGIESFHEGVEFYYRLIKAISSPR
jgi:acetylornithine deacetylase/succinyl-diaminopimelate desuccinylase-like protein